MKRRLALVTTNVHDTNFAAVVTDCRCEKTDLHLFANNNLISKVHPLN